ncbi:Subtilisin-like protease SBT5.3, partial [Linum perenne]
STISNVAPWDIMVASSTTEREFPSYVVVGNRMRFKVSKLLWLGEVGMVLVNDFTTGNEVIADAHIFPASHVNYPTDYITSTKKPIAYITPLEIQIRKRRAPSMAAISSKEPNRITPKMLKDFVLTLESCSYQVCNHDH